MVSNSLDPLPLKDMPKGKVSAFPFSNFSRPEQKMEEPDRLRQLEQMLSKNQERSAEIEREAYDKAYAAGEKAGLALGQKRAEQILIQMQQMLDDSKSQFDEIRQAMCEAIVDISGAISEWLIGEITNNDHKRLLEMAEKAVHALPEMTHLKMAVHPDDFAQFEKLFAESKHQTPLLADANVAPNCIRIFNKTQDVLIDPSLSIAKAVTHFKTELLSDKKQ